MRQEGCGAVNSIATTPFNGGSELLCVPVDNDGCEQVQPGDAEVLTFDGSITDFALTPNSQGIFQGMVSLVKRHLLLRVKATPSVTRTARFGGRTPPKSRRQNFARSGALFCQKFFEVAQPI